MTTILLFHLHGTSPPNPRIRSATACESDFPSQFATKLKRGRRPLIFGESRRSFQALLTSLSGVRIRVGVFILFITSIKAREVFLD
jgi:hypothetical protein